jgi:uncharacterized protein (TIGR03435 family)
MTRLRSLVLLIALTGIGLAAQQPAPAFEVTSIKRPDPATSLIRIAINEVQPGGVWRSSSTLLSLIRALYPGHSFPGQVEGGANWIGSEFYEMEARARATASAQEIRGMAQMLLADRFKLIMHTETRDVPAYVLRLARRDGKLGPGFTKPAIDCDVYRAAEKRGDVLPVDRTRKPNADRLPCTSTMMPVFDHTRVIAGANWRLTAGGATVGSIVALLARELERPVLDQTGLTQFFDIELQFSNTPPTPDAEAGPPLKAALSDQLGLSLEDGRTSMEVLVIDRVERPTPN